ncbi:hypothetical protein [Natrinema sp. SYSU A 869]|nr:hypothetical protein [Natrinema sp. SYSU A 869]
MTVAVSNRSRHSRYREFGAYDARVGRAAGGGQGWLETSGSNAVD